jgi:aminodeoxyfutalosine deaminase
MAGPRPVPEPLAPRLAALPKAELHLHLEGAIEPPTVVELAARYGDSIAAGQVSARYATRDFAAFIEAYKWVTSYLRAPQDYALVASETAERLLVQNVVYAEITLSAGVMLLRQQDPEANFRAIREAVRPFESLGLRLQWIFDCVRQFGPRPAMEVARIAANLRQQGVVAFGIGGDELALPASDFRPAFEFAAAQGLHIVAHAGEIGGPDSVRDALDCFGAERIGHGIATTRDPALAARLRERSIPLEICPTSNLRTGALARQVGRDDAELKHHPLPDLLRAGVPLSVSTDDPAMFGTNLNGEYLLLVRMGLTPQELKTVAASAFEHSFLPQTDKASYLATFEERAAAIDPA